jgi:hypothetical protein
MSEIITDQCNFIIIGAWNPAIIQPGWLKKQFPQLIKEDKFNIELITGPIATFRFEVNNILISPNNDRLIFTPREVNEACLDFISKISFSIFDKLPHTPVLAAGCNFVYKLKEKESFTISEFKLPEDASKFYKDLELNELTSKQIRHIFSFSDYNLNITYILNAESKNIHYNFDYPIKDTNLIKKASESFKEHYALTLKLNSNLIKEN